VIETHDEINGIAWKSNQSLDKNKFYVYSTGGAIEEIDFIEKTAFVLDLSSRGHICMGSLENKKGLHSIPLMDHPFDFTALQEQYHSPDLRSKFDMMAVSYSEEGSKYLDI
jgi:hypothetical protein